MSTVGERIKQGRNTKGMTQKQLAKKLGVSENYINDVENGRKVVEEKFIERVGKVLGGDLAEMTTLFDNIAYEERKSSESNLKTHNAAKANKVKETINEVWNDAFSSVLKSVGIYSYDLNKPIGKKELPVISNKIEGYAQDKVLYIKIENDDLLGFRICQGDLALANLTSEIENNKIYLMDINGERVIRQLKKLDSNKVLIISNKNMVRTETAHPKDIKVIAKLNRLEIQL
ncbi:MAG: XRE family transcriptional regulator [Clostridium sulfidigenes]|uniref:XRE family transcriptional regulator n=1 Tax=Clostridium sulfidigenes TaxID=318464 RepID=A0A927WDA5_9CLOT|nr:XRE family transcriptional regulator [Clostridium sulfidigenes]